MNREEFINQSLELNLFWARIMKEHCIFLEAGLPCKEARLMQKLDRFKVRFETLLFETAEYSAALPAYVVQSGAFITEYTEGAENKTMELSGITINTRLTAFERRVLGEPRSSPAGRMPRAYETVRVLNSKAAESARDLAELQKELLDSVMKCELFSFNYPAVYRHMNDEVAEYIKNLDMLAANEPVNKSPCRFEEFWNRNMQEHAATVRGLLDPSEDTMFERANTFTGEFGALNGELKKACASGGEVGGATKRAIELTEGMKRYNSESLRAGLSGSLQSIMPPLLSDHLMREANYYLLLLPE